MKSKRFPVAALAVAATLLAGTVQAETTLRYATSLPSTSSVYEASVPGFIERVNQATDGKLTIQAFPSGQLASAKGTLAALKDGTADAGLLIPIFTPSETRNLNAISQILFAGSNSIAITGATAETVLINCPACVSEMAEQNVMPLAVYATTAYYLQCADDVPSYDSLRGRKMRIAGGGQRELVADMGATRVVVTGPDLMESMSRGQIDCALTSLPWLNSYSLMDSVEYIVDYPVGTFRAPDAFAISKSAWEKLDTESRQAIVKEIPRLLADTVINGYLAEEDQIRDQAKAAGITFLPADEKFKQAVVSIQEREKEIGLADAKTRGVEDAEAVWDSHLKSLDKWERLSKEIGNDPQRFADALWEHVYSKLNL